ncbi:MAG TPA: hypothetical protein VMU39_23070, partial [Solirubrobacteraceae bacterium]|nr:hypothetical protein [Solirubrobacteraceae bacterium]
MTPIVERSALALAASIRRGELSAREVVDAHIARHQLWAPRINALVADRFDRARAEAAAADERVVAASAAT